MKVTALAIAALLPFTTLSAPAAEAEPAAVADIDSPALEKRFVTGTVLTDGLRYRTCPRIACAADGQFPIGTQINIRCFEDTNTTPVEGDRYAYVVASRINV